MNEGQRRSILEELAEQYRVPTVPDDAFTVDDFRQVTGLGEQVARRTLKAEVKAGRLVEHSLSVGGGKKRNWYWRAPGAGDEGI